MLLSPSNGPNQQIKPHPTRWHYPLITYLTIKRYQPNQKEWLYDSDKKKEFSIPSWIENKPCQSSKCKCAKQIQFVLGKAELHPIKCSEKSYTVCEMVGMPEQARLVSSPNK